MMRGARGVKGASRAQSNRRDFMTTRDVGEGLLRTPTLVPFKVLVEFDFTFVEVEIATPRCASAGST